MPGNASEAARELFADLRYFDSLGVAEVWVETVPAASEWDGIRDRLKRAAT
jgi:L-threonylcarbamoyladenylate synthase